MEDKILPVGLKGYQISERMKELMGTHTTNESNKKSVIELTKLGPDGKVYGIVRENHEYYIKTTTKQDKLVTEDFSYIGGLQNKKDFAYPSYAKAIKHLNLKFNSLNESLGKTDKINVFENDNLSEDVAGFYSQGNSGFANEGNLEHHAKSSCCDAPLINNECSSCGTIKEDDSQLSEVDQAVEDLNKEEVAPVTEVKRLSIKRSLEGMDGIIDEIFKDTNKKKVYTIK